MTDTATTDLLRPSTRAQWAAVLLTAALVAVLAIGLPRVAESSAQDDTAIATGERVEAGDIAVTVAGGWALDGATDLLVLNKRDAKFVVLPPSKSPQSPEDAVAEMEQGYTADTSVHATIGEVKTFTTDSGLSAASLSVVQPDLVTVVYAYSDGKSLATANATAIPDTWAAVQSDVAAMETTVEFAGGSAS
jgi:hypothetical protein